MSSDWFFVDEVALQLIYTYDVCMQETVKSKRRMVRKQVFITADQNRRLKTRAAATGVSEAELIRAGIDLRLQQEAKSQRAWSDVVTETVGKLSGAWAERANLDEEMREIRRRWNRRDQLLGKKAKRAS
jgi:hypothetical protein